jgi:hypothetical protein
MTGEDPAAVSYTACSVNSALLGPELPDGPKKQERRDRVGQLVLEDLEGREDASDEPLQGDSGHRADRERERQGPGVGEPRDEAPESHGGAGKEGEQDEAREEPERIHSAYASAGCCWAGRARAGMVAGSRNGGTCQPATRT